MNYASWIGTTQKLDHNDHGFNSVKTVLKEMSHHTGGSCQMHICWFCALFTVERGSAKCSPMATSSLLPVFINKVLLEHSQIHLFTYCQGCFCAEMSALSNHSRDSAARKADRPFSIWLFTEALPPQLRRKRTDWQAEDTNDISITHN